MTLHAPSNLFVLESEKVTNVLISNVTTSGFRLSWSAPNTTNGDLINYNVNISNATFLHYVNVSLSSPMVNVNNLDAGNKKNILISVPLPLYIFLYPFLSVYS